MEQPGLCELIYKTIMATDLNVRSHFYNNIILSGGTTLIPGVVLGFNDYVTLFSSIVIMVKAIARVHLFFDYLKCLTARS